MAISVRELYNQICDGLLEPGALTGDVFSDADFINTVNQVVSQFLELGAYIKPLINKTIQDQRIYESPGPTSVTKNVAVDESGITMNSGFYWDQSDAYWQNNPSGNPQEWKSDRLEVQGLEVRPAPDWTGFDVAVSASLYGVISATSGAVYGFDIDCDPLAVSGLLGTISECDYGSVYVDCAGPMLGTIADMQVSELNITHFDIVAPQYTITSLDDYIPDIAESFLPYLRLATMRILSNNDAETKSVNGSKYYTSRTQEGAALISSITEESTE